MPCNRFREIDLAAFVVDPTASEWPDFQVHQLLCADCAPEVEKIRALVETMHAARNGDGVHDLTP